jgi:hypothetical protein
MKKPTKKPKLPRAPIPKPTRAHRDRRTQVKHKLNWKHQREEGE